MCNADTLNTPENFPYGILRTELSSNYITQTYTSVSNYAVFYRVNATNGMIDTWRRIDNFGCNTMEELAAALKPLL